MTSNITQHYNYICSGCGKERISHYSGKTRCLSCNRRRRPSQILSATYKGLEGGISQTFFVRLAQLAKQMTREALQVSAFFSRAKKCRKRSSERSVRTTISAPASVSRVSRN
jgi:hypothetical protein